MTKEALEKALTTPYCGIEGNLLLEWILEDEYGFSRHLKVTTETGFSFVILWHTNLLTLEFPNGLSIWADSVFLSSTMPHNSILDLRSKKKGVDGICLKIRLRDIKQ